MSTTSSPSFNNFGKQNQAQNAFSSDFQIQACGSHLPEARKCAVEEAQKINEQSNTFAALREMAKKAGAPAIVAAGAAAGWFTAGGRMPCIW